jgi:phosphoserine phosphatase RsbU/P
MHCSADYDLPSESVAQILELTLKLSRPFDLLSMLREVVGAAREVLDAERGSVFLHDRAAGELVMTVVEDIAPVRVPMGRGIVGHCALERQLINVPDCQADPRFNPEIDRASGFRTRCMLSLPLIGDGDELVGVLQLLNKQGGVFDERDERVALVLAAHCASALQRVRTLEALLAAEHLHEEIRVAREIQMSGLPDAMPPLAGYDGAGLFCPTDQTGGDLYDFVPVGREGMFLLLGDATGHGIGPALSATQVRAMVRVALRLGAELDEIHAQVNNQLLHDLPDDRFVTAFLGMLDAGTHVVRYHAAGQAPLLHLRGTDGTASWHGATTIPMGALELSEPDPAHTLAMAPGDVLGLISDGVYEYEDPAGRQFGEQRVAALIAAMRGRPMREVADALLAAVREFGAGGKQADDVTIVLLRRLPDGAAPDQESKDA